MDGVIRSHSAKVPREARVRSMNTILLVFALKLITVIDGRASGVSEPFYIRWRVTVRRENSCIQRVKYLFLVGERLPITVVLHPDRGFSRPAVITHRSCRTARRLPRRSSSVPRGCLLRLQAGRSPSAPTQYRILGDPVQLPA